ncbi:MAG: hypothetical protein Q4C68_01955 [Moraxella sp.]|nr:hypothetical protein [Moraxella sp.]
MNKRLLTYALGAIMALIATHTHANTIAPADNLCRNDGIVFGYFNGVQTTNSTARAALRELKYRYQTQTSTGEAIRYELLYNSTHGFGDFVEVFEQRLLEHHDILKNRYELFIQTLNSDSSTWDKLAAALSLQTAYNEYKEAQVAAAVASINGTSQTLASTYAEHQARIDTWAIEGKKMLFVAHSQGNLFLNPAFDYAKTKIDPNVVKAVHIAPASPTLRGEHTLADKDLVINGLRAVGSVPDNTNIIAGYLLRPAGLNGKTDFLGHGLLEIYLNPRISTSNRINGHINSALSDLSSRQVEARATSGFFTTTLTWDGTGDVDLHTFEPSGKQVWYRSMTGDSGYLDVDNTVAYGPEHYYATCDKTKLKEGIYQVKLANYARATGRVATVQIASNKQGVLATKTATMGAVTGQVPTFDMFSVEVKKDASGQYTVRVVQ